MKDKKLIITGGHKLKGNIRIKGAKNLVSKAMVASLLTDEVCTITDVPYISDVRIVKDILTFFGANVNIANDIVRICTKDIIGDNVIDKSGLDVYMKASRIPILMCGPLLHRFNVTFVPNLGGCRLGTRPIDFHLDALRKMGINTIKRSNGLYLKVKNKIHGAIIDLPYPSVGATEQVLLTSVLAEGITELKNAALEPEIIDLIMILQKMGAHIDILSNRIIRIVGVDKLYGFTHKPIPDRIEVASWAAAALATDGHIVVDNIRHVDIMPFLNVFRMLGGEFEIQDTDKNITSISFWRKNSKIHPVYLETGTHPGFLTDWQQPIAVVMTQGDGLSIIHETVYENRFGFTTVLNKMGAKIQLYRDCLGGSQCRFKNDIHLHSAVIFGLTKLKGCKMSIPDLRGGFSYVISALVSSGKSEIDNIDIINRGYEVIFDKLSNLGVKFDVVGN